MPDKVKEREPLWRDEFSISKADERYVNRRQLAKFLTLGSLGMFAGNCWILVRSWLRKAQVYRRSVIAKAGEIPIGGREIVPVSEAWRAMHPDPDCGRRLCRI